MDAGAIISVLTGVAGVVGGFLGGRRLGNSQAQETAVNTVELLQIAVAELERQGRAKDTDLADLRGRVGVLEDLVTQRAEVDGVREVVDRIAIKMGA